ncbi:MAG: SGNH/GDSL hydrolase family protein [Planctomycetales bacterium]|nr:SGNH/GDSL hydrolase family protein [Planctomycetales bacterium]
MSHVVLLGDSIFDNGFYVSRGSSVIDQLQAKLPSGWKASLAAVDGAVASSVLRQLERIPADATHLVVSAGGNNALQNSDLLRETDLTAPAAFAELAKVHQEFQKEYRTMLQAVLALRLPTAVCTIYDSLPDFPAAAITALAVFNDIILREAFRCGLPILDLRLICDEHRDYSPVSPIEPSEIGGHKIVQGIYEIVTTHDFGRHQNVVYGKS